MPPKNKKSKPIGVAIVGAGTVGGGVLRLLRDNRKVIKARCGRELKVVSIVVRNLKAAKRRLPAAEIKLLSNDWNMAASDSQTDIVVELMGGKKDAKRCIKTALNAGKAVVTANKALLAENGDDIFSTDKTVAYEAAVAGCIPVVKILREALAGDSIIEVCGIINGTCNYILSAMEKRGLSFKQALAEAQHHGYAEANPSLDVNGTDAAHKLALIARLAYGAHPQMADIHTVGLKNLEHRDLSYAAQFGFCIKLLALARLFKGRLQLSVQPMLIPKSHPLAVVDGVMNAVTVNTCHAGETMYYGAGAGAGPTAVAVVADLIDIVRKNGAQSTHYAVASPPLLSPNDAQAPYYLRLRVLDIPGVLADITRLLASAKISIEAIYQNESTPHQEVDVIMLLHETSHGRVTAAVGKIENLNSVADGVVVMPIKTPLKTP